MKTTSRNHLTAGAAGLPSNSFCILFIRAFVLLFVSICPFTGHAQDAATFLYRIQGKALIKPSYLLGTVHRTDYKLFNFSDSLYQALQQADVFAMEVHPDSIFGKMIDKIVKESAAPTLKELLSAGDLKTFKRKYQKFFSDPVENMTLAQIVSAKEKIIAPAKKQDDMPLFMDMYLMQMSRKMGKPIAGLEQIDAQLNLMDSLLKGKDPMVVMKNMESDQKWVESIVEAYMAGDLSEISKFVATMPSDVEELLLSRRNLVMLQSITKLSNKQSLFAAVGAAHLPGPKGLIQLLKDAGYEVVPVFGSQKIHASIIDKTLKQVNLPWHHVDAGESGFEVEMPLSPAINELDGRDGKMYVAMDWATQKAYIAAGISIQAAMKDLNTDSLLQIIGKSMIASMKPIGDPKIQPTTLSGKPAWELSVVTKSKENVQGWIMLRGSMVYMLMVSSGTPLAKTDPDLMRFVASFKSKTPAAKGWKIYSDSAELFTLQVPVSLKKTVKIGEEENVTDFTYYGMNTSTGVEYLVSLSKCRAGVEFENDSLVVRLVLDNLRKSQDYSEFNEQVTSWFGYPSTVINARLASGILVHLKTLQRGNRFYLVGIFGSKTHLDSNAVSRFFDSFEILPYAERSLQMQQFSHFSLPIESDSAYFPVADDGAIDTTRVFVYYPGLATTLTLSTRSVNNYTWAVSDSAFWSNVLHNYAGINDKTILLQQIGNHPIYPSLDFELENVTSHQHRYVRMLRVGDKMYEISINTDPEAALLTGYRRGFQDIQFPKPTREIDITSRSARKYFAAMDTASPPVFEEMIGLIHQLPFDKNDLPLLFEMAGKKLLADTASNYDLENSIWQIIGKLADSSHIPQIVQAYRQANEQTDAPLMAATLLAQLGTRESYKHLRSMIPLPYPPHKLLSNLFSITASHPAVAADCLQAWYPLLTNLDYGTGVLMLHRQLRDSGFIPSNPKGYSDSVIVLAQKVETFVKAVRPETIYFLPDLIEELKNTNTPAAKSILHQLALGMPEYESARFIAIQSLLDVGEKPTAAITSLAKQPYWRQPLLSKLVEAKQLTLFPASYQNQASMAESYLWQVEDADMDTLIAAGDFDMMYDGKKCKFYIFKAGYKVAEAMEYYIAFAGPFSLSSKAFFIDQDVENISGVTEQLYKKVDVPKVLKDWIKEWESYKAEEEE